MSAGGLSRRRVAASSSQGADDDGDAWGLNGSSTPASSSHAPSPSVSTNNLAHAGSAFAGGSKIAYDPRDLINEGEEDARLVSPQFVIGEEQEHEEGHGHGHGLGR